MFLRDLGLGQLQRGGVPCELDVPVYGELEGERLIFELWYYLGDEWTFVCERRM